MLQVCKGHYLRNGDGESDCSLFVYDPGQLLRADNGLTNDSAAELERSGSAAFFVFKGHAIPGNRSDSCNL